MNVISNGSQILSLMTDYFPFGFIFKRIFSSQVSLLKFDDAINDVRYPLSNWSPHATLTLMFTISSGESQKGRYHYSKMFRWEPEGRYCHRHCTALAPFWFATEHLWILIAPFWLSTDDIKDMIGNYKQWIH